MWGRDPPSSPRSTLSETLPQLQERIDFLHEDINKAAGRKKFIAPYQFIFHPLSTDIPANGGASSSGWDPETSRFVLHSRFEGDKYPVLHVVQDEASLAESLELLALENGGGSSLAFPVEKVTPLPPSRWSLLNSHNRPLAKLYGAGLFGTNHGSPPTASPLVVVSR